MAEWRNNVISIAPRQLYINADSPNHIHYFLVKYNPIIPSMLNGHRSKLLNVLIEDFLVKILTGF